MSPGTPDARPGSGPPLVILPGLGPAGSARRDAALTGDLRPFRPLARHHALHVLHRRTGLARGTTIAALADDCAATLTARFAGPVDVLGVSTGGSIAQQLAVTRPRLVRRLVLLCSACRLSPHGRAVQRSFARRLEAGDVRRAWAGAGAALAAGRAGSRFLGALMWAVGPSTADPDPSDLIATIEAEDAFDIEDDLARVEARTLVVAGARDRFYSPELFRLTAARIPGARLLLHRSAGHAGVLTRERTTREILRFLDEP
ncbi:alpha/beta fold hydrolase [Spirilliplanes yamanashiensis]|uniref:Uncharacterized protein n=1 Tax=Spirilliplanes yamanashiensis TaxID=42233 RepID=A0A8J3YFH0_9ACTN|nr:alpha/beta hydrolase [Spirilliplanes yamanashiensis]MDP9818227.1 pimeloyl-ACP methyl ester carboxylesterase [Spirilliplanes yamanashiensis]GIJ06745.1 hypothetical protein Sya03_60970 [Spirilliplanes yamanashiensis]